MKLQFVISLCTNVGAFAFILPPHSSLARTYQRNLSQLQGKDTPAHDAELVDDKDFNEEEFEWLPDSEKARLIQESRFKAAEANPADFYGNSSGKTQTYPVNDKSQEKDDLLSDEGKGRPSKKRLTYTDEEEELISILGGKNRDNPSPKREIGFLGDCTLKEIALDYQVPICYLADVLCGWGVPAPINPSDTLGDMITGEQAFAILEAIHTLDMGALNDRYADYDLATLCNEYEIDLADGFELAMKEGWNLPFGVRTFLRVEQEEHLVETLAKERW
jgi:hypothetical protein